MKRTSRISFISRKLYIFPVEEQIETSKNILCIPLFSYEVSFGEFIFKRSEKCHIIEETGVHANNSELSCIGKTNFSRISDSKNVTNFADYTYSSNGFNHTGETFKVSGNYYRLNELDLAYGLQAEPITLKLNSTPATKKLQFEYAGKGLIVQ